MNKLIVLLKVKRGVVLHMKVEYKGHEFNIKDDKVDDWNDLLKNNDSDYGKHILEYVACYCWCLEMCMEDGTGIVKAFIITDKASNKWNLSIISMNK